MIYDWLGEIPKEICDLPDLEFIDLVSNQLSGPCDKSSDVYAFWSVIG
jgi:hypothetical protein